MHSYYSSWTLSFVLGVPVQHIPVHFTPNPTLYVHYVHVQTKTIIPPSLYYENESPYKFVILIYQLINLPLKLYEEFVARYSQILFDPGRKKFPTNRFTL